MPFYIQINLYLFNSSHKLELDTRTLSHLVLLKLYFTVIFYCLSISIWHLEMEMPVLDKCGCFTFIQIHPRRQTSSNFIKERSLYSIFSEKLTFFFLYCHFIFLFEFIKSAVHMSLLLKQTRLALYCMLSK